MNISPGMKKRGRAGNESGEASIPDSAADQDTAGVEVSGQEAPSGLHTA